jgi:hypothetical protein
MLPWGFELENASHAFDPPLEDVGMYFPTPYTTLHRVPVLEMPAGGNGMEGLLLPIPPEAIPPEIHATPG